MSRARHYEKVVEVPASPDTLFGYLDDVRRLASHMERPSAMMLGGSMACELDAGSGRVVGSVIRIRGRVLGLEMLVEEVVTVRAPPWRKTWETRAPARLLIIGGYRMGFEITAVPIGSALCVFIDYEIPNGFVGRLAGMLLGRSYARWCVDRVTADARQRFLTLEAAQSGSS
jgi:hypothetical protein